MSKLKTKGKKMYQVNINQKKAWVAISMSEKVDFRARKVTKGEQEQYIKINR